MPASAKGFDGLTTKLAMLADLKSVDADVQASLEEAAEIVYESAKSKCKSASVRDAIQEPKKDDTSKRPAMVIRVEHERAAVEEFGTGPRTGARGPHNFPARPFMRPAADENKPQVLNSIVEQLKTKFEAKGAG